MENYINFYIVGKKKHDITGRIKNNSIEPLSYEARHQQLVKEMIKRNMKHNSPLKQPDFSYLPATYLFYKVDILQSLFLLLGRCPACYNNFRKLKRRKENE